MKTGNTYTFPIYDPYTQTWIIDNRDGTTKVISQEEYDNTMRTFKTRYDKNV